MTTTVSKPSEFSCGLMHEVVVTACKVGWFPHHFTQLAQSEEKMRQLLLVFDGCAEIKLIQPSIDLDADPWKPLGWEVEEHRKGGKWKFDPAQIKFHLCSGQTTSGGQTTSDRFVKGSEFRKELESVPVANANLLDWFVAHPEFVPKEWEHRTVFFWGTVYRDGANNQCVRVLQWGEDGWDWDHVLLNGLVHSNRSLVFAS